MNGQRVTAAEETGTLSYDERHGTVWTPPLVVVTGLLGGTLEGRLVRHASDYWTVYAGGCEYSFDPNTPGVQVFHA